MSLGPPFDESGERLQYGVGAAATLALVAAVAISLLASDRTLGDTFPLSVRVKNPGNIHTGAHVVMAGQQIGEVVAIRGTGWSSSGGPRAPAGEPGVEFELRVLRSWQRYVYRNSTIFSSTPNVLTEAYLEIGPPRGAAPDRPVEPGEVLRGVDPPDVDRLLDNVNGSLTTILAVSRELSPAWADFLDAFGHLTATARGLSQPVSPGQIILQGGRALEASRHLRDALAQADALPRTRRLAAELSRSFDDLRPQLRALSGQMDHLDEQLKGVTTAFGPAQREQLSRGVALFREVIRNAEQIDADLRWLADGVREGRGTIGGMVNDLQVYDEFKELRRILLNRTWRVLIKRPDPGQRRVR